MSLGHHSIFEDQARELYLLCDEEKKGYITKEDMYRLSSHLPLDKGQFDSVFDSLDDDNNGNLTLEEFIVGFSKYLGAPVEIPHDETEFDEDHSSMKLVAQEHLDHLVERMKTVGLIEDIDMIKETWNRLQDSNAELLSHFETIIENIIMDMSKAKSVYCELEGVLKSKTNTYEEEMKRLYDEMDIQIKTEKERLLNEEKNREKQIKDELEKKIREKDKFYHETLKIHDETMKELNNLSNIHSESSQERERLERERNDLESKLRSTDKALRDCQEYIEELNKKAKQDRRKRAKAAIEMTEGIALERESLVRELDDLRLINEKLMNEKNQKLSNLSKSNSQVNLLKEIKQAQNDNQLKVVDVQDYMKKKRGSILSSYFTPSISVNEGSFDHCQTISYENEEEMINEFRVSVNNYEYSDFKDHNGELGFADIRPPRLCKTSMSQEMEVQTEIFVGDLGERSPPDGAAQEIDILNGPEKPERIFKVVFIGDSSVGKTSIIKRFCNNEFRNDGIASTIGVDFQIKSIRADGYFVALQLWDTAGQERFRSITSHYYRKADGVILVYDVLSESSLVNLRQWMEDVKEVVEDETVIMVLANKSDLIETEMDKDNADKLKNVLHVDNILFFCCSAKTGENVQELFLTLAKTLTSKQNNNLKSAFQLESSSKRGCCGR